MTVEEFFRKYEYKTIDYDGYHGDQCMDLYRQYAKECLEYPQTKFVGGAKDVWNNYLPNYYDRVAYAEGEIPRKGDIILWNKYAGGGFGHVAIFSHGDAQNFISFDQNWPTGSACHFQQHNYRNVIGWLRPDKLVLKETPDITDQTKIEIGGNYGVMEVQAIRSALLNQHETIKNLEKELKQRIEEDGPELKIETIDWKILLAQAFKNLTKRRG